MRSGISLPKFANRFFRADFEAELMPVLSLYPIPAPMDLESTQIDICGQHQHPHPVSWSALSSLPRVTLKQPFVCQIFNWSEEITWEGIRLVDLLDFLKVDTDPEGYFAVHSRDRIYFEGLSRDEARDPRVLLAYALNGNPLPAVHGGPLRLVVPFLQGYKSVKWIRAIYAYRHDPVGTKRLLGQSERSPLNETWRKKYAGAYDILPPEGRTGDPPLSLPSTSVVQNTEEDRVDEMNGTQALPVVFPPLEGKIESKSGDVKKTKHKVGRLKELIAILRPEKHELTRQALEAAGITSYTTYAVLGRSHQRGLRLQSDLKEEKKGAVIKFLPKQYFSIVLPEARLSAAIAVIMKANRSGKGAVGDGRIFVTDIDEAVRISNDDRGVEAAQ